ncbi:MAG: ABC transporter substrate-binding protein, partial [Gammaproteobacteria bacterium]|nr:ABC transporter substrate-binding protein [Gammaproteobacteria bacterium]
MLRVPLFLVGIGLLSCPAMAADDPPDASTASAQGGEVVFGQSAALSGPASELGTEMRLGLTSAFAEVNAKGGVHGRHLVLRSLDDAYEPEAAVANTRELIDEHDVFALVGAVGTPTSRAAEPVTSDAGVPY